MRDRLIELIREAKHSWSLSTMVNCDFDTWIAEHLLENGVTVQEWISVKDRLPEWHESVLAYRQSACGDYSKVAIERTFLYEGKLYFSGDCDCWKTSVTHWMPLPQPPKGA